MSAVVVVDGALVVKDPADVKVYRMDWDTENLAEAAAIATSTWTVTPISPSTSDALLVKDQSSILAGSRQTQIRLAAGTLGQTYEIANAIVTTESPAQTKERSFRVVVQDR